MDQKRGNPRNRGAFTSQNRGRQAAGSQSYEPHSQQGDQREEYPSTSQGAWRGNPRNRGAHDSHSQSRQASHGSQSYEPHSQQGYQREKYPSTSQGAWRGNKRNRGSLDASGHRGQASHGSQPYEPQPQRRDEREEYPSTSQGAWKGKSKNHELSKAPGSSHEPRSTQSDEQLEQKQEHPVTPQKTEKGEKTEVQGSGEEQPQLSAKSTNGSKVKRGADGVKDIVSPESLIIPKRKGFGTRGSSCKLEVNFLKLKINPEMNIYHYHVEFNPDKPKKLFRVLFNELIRKYFPTNRPAFDGKQNIYSCGELPLKGNSLSAAIEITDPVSENVRAYTVEVKWAATLPLNELRAYMRQGNCENIQEYIQAFDIALRSRPSQFSIKVGRSFFQEPREPIDLGDGLDLWHGFYQSCVVGFENSFLLNVDVAHKAFPKRMNVAVYMHEYCFYEDRNRVRKCDYEKAMKFLRGLTVEYQMPQTHQKRSYTIRDLSDTPNRIRFRVGDISPEMTVTEYFRREKNYNIRYPDLPCLLVGQNTQLPMELCTIISNQALNRKLNEKQTSTMIRFSAKPPPDRKRNILQSIKSTQYNNDPCLNEFGIQVDDKFVTVNARILSRPRIEYAENKSVDPVGGAWRENKFFEVRESEINCWAILDLSSSYPDKIERFVKILISMGDESGIRLSKPVVIEKIYQRSEQCEIVEKLKSLNNKFSRLQFVLIIMPSTREYATIKKAAELEVGVLTQCVLSNTVDYKSNGATAKNILLKVNAKLNGVNHTVSQFRLLATKEPTMIMGADVTHPSPDQTSIPSIAAVTASYDAYGFRYMMEYRLQSARKEVIVDLEEIMCNMLNKFLLKTGHKPARIIFYRDGVSEGQFYEILKSEFIAIRSACWKTWNKDYRPGITLIVVQKRHHARFFPPADSKLKDRRTENVLPGTIIDTDIVHPTEMNFYLVSHAAIKGTARPTKYHLLHDDNEYTADELQQLTNQLCYLFARCSRAVSYPAPTYYAHLAAFRARHYMERRDLQPGEMDRLNTARHCGLVKDHLNNNNPMFFV